jgi:hypothetical protein
MTPNGNGQALSSEGVRKNPYAGPRALQQGEPIYGRTREINELRGAVLSERIVLLYSQSGAGKTSLIEAGLRPEFEQRRFQVMPTIRVGYESPHETPDANRYTLSVLTSLERAKPLAEQVAPEILASISLKDYFQDALDAESELDLFLVFDQFEEIFTLDPTDWDTKEAFLHDLGTAMTNRSVFALFSMREDFIAQLDPYQSAMPTRFSNTYRLELLGPSDARMAIQKPAEAAGVEFADDAAQGLVDDLRRVRVDRGATSSLELGPSVEPVQLQVVCAQLWDHLDPAASAIRSENVDDIGNVNEALAGYYASQVVSVAGRTHVKESHIRDWFEDKLISDDGFRTQTREGPGRKSDAVLTELEDAHLIRADRRRGTQWYELTHDRFVEPIRASNREFHSRRRAKLLKILVPVGILILMGLTSLVVDLLASPGSAAPAEQIEGTSVTRNPSVDAGVVTRYRFDDGERFDVVTLVVSADSSGSALGGVPDIDVRLLQLGTGDAEGEAITVPPVASTDGGASAVGASGDVQTSSTTSTTRGSPSSGDRSTSQQTVRRVEVTYSLPASGAYFIEISSSTGGSIELNYAREAGVQASELDINDSFDGQLTATEPVGRFDFTVEDDATVELVLDSISPLDGILTVVNDIGGIVDSVDYVSVAEPESLVVRPSISGTYTVEVSGYEGTLGEYQLEIRRPELTPIEADSSVEGTTLSDGRASVYSFSADEGETIIVTLSYEPDAFPQLEVKGDSSRKIGLEAVDGLSSRVAQLWPGGDGIVIVSEPFGEPGDYTLTFERQMSTAIEVGEEISGAARVGERQSFSFNGTWEEIYAVDVSGVDAVVQVVPPDDQFIIGDVFIAPTDGEHLVMIEPFSTGDFTLLITEPELESIAFGSSKATDVATGKPTISYTFDADEGDTYSIAVAADGISDFDLLLVTAPDGFLEVLEFGDPDTGGVFANATAPIDGTYLITVIPDGPGVYTVSLDP